MIFFTSDNHFGHENILKFESRPFSSAEEMDEYMILKWNEKVKARDTVYIVGDMFLRHPDPESVLKRLKGQKRLVLGNHDASWIDKVDVSKYFESVDKFLEVSDGERGLTLCHYPMLQWKHEKKSYMIHGHIHSDTDFDFWPMIKARKRVLNAGADINGLVPVTFNELLENNIKWKEAN